MSKKCGSIKSLSDGLNDLEWNGQKLFDWFDHGVLIKEETEDGLKSKVGVSINRYHKTTWRTTPEISKDIKKILFNGNMSFVIDDTKRGGIGRLKLHIANIGDERESHTYYLIKGNPSEIDEVKEFLGGADNSDFIYTSNMEKPESNSSGRSYSKSGGSCSAMVFDHETSKFVATSMSVKTEGAYYLTETRGSVNYNDKDYYIDQISLILNSISNTGYDISDMKIFLVKPSVVINRKLSERENWTEATETMLYILKELLETNLDKVERSINIAVLSKEYNASKIEQILEALKLDCEIKDIYGEYRENYDEVSEFKDSMNGLYNACRISELECPKSERFCDASNDDQFSSKVDKIIEDKYMLIANLCDGWRDLEEDLVNELVNYIVLKETCGE